MSRQRRAVATALLAAGTLLAATWLGPATGPLGAQEGAGSYAGSLLYLQGGEVWRLDLRTQERSRLVATGGVVTHLAHAPDRQRLAYSVLFIDPSFRILGSDIVVADAEGGDPRPVVHEEGTIRSVTWPAWSGDGARLAYTATDLLDGRQRIEEMDLASGGRTVLVDEGSSPSLSPDGLWLAYSYSTDRGWGIGSLHRPSGARRLVVEDTWFLDSDIPTFAPHGDVLAFVAAGTGPPTRGAGLLPTLLGLLRAPSAPAAWAHDIDEPFDLWTVGPDGSGLRRVAVLRNEQPYVAWSPDGRYVAAWGRAGLQVVEMATGTVRQLSAEPGTGPISWGH